MKVPKPLSRKHRGDGKLEIRICKEWLESIQCISTTRLGTRIMIYVLAEGFRRSVLLENGTVGIYELGNVVVKCFAYILLYEEQVGKVLQGRTL